MPPSFTYAGRAARAALLVSLIAGAAVSAQEKSEPKPVLVELFTSEGCSDCPPADEILAKLDHDQVIPGVQAIVLSEHVTYWNHEGWRDPFSMQQMDFRQQDYVARFHLASSYTPQMVVDGQVQFVGNDPKALLRAMDQISSVTPKPLSIEDASWDRGEVRFTARTSAEQGAHLFAALAEDVTRSEVSSGENAGRTLHHVAVVRSMREFKSGFVNAPQHLSASNVDKSISSLRLVVFLADPHNGHVVAAAEKTLQKP